MVVEAQKLLKEPTSEREFYQYDPKPIDKTIHDERQITTAEVSWSSRIQLWSIPLSEWQPLRHPRCEEVSREVNSYFMSEWNFPSEDAKRKFIDLLEDMSLQDGEAYNNSLIPIIRGDVFPDRSKPAEYILYDLWQSMRSHDKTLADGVLEPIFSTMRAQTDGARLQITELGQYLEYREKDVGKALLSALMRFSMDIHMTEKELAGMKILEQNSSKQISVVNDIYSWEKELQASKTGHKEGSALCSAVKVLADSTNLDAEASKRVLWSLVREWEHVHDSLCEAKLLSSEGCSKAEQMYVKGLEYQMSGNELWSKTTKRYSVAG